VTPCSARCPERTHALSRCHMVAARVVSARRPPPTCRSKGRRAPSRPTGTPTTRQLLISRSIEQGGVTDRAFVHGAKVPLPVNRVGDTLKPITGVPLAGLSDISDGRHAGRGAAWVRPRAPRMVMSSPCLKGGAPPCSNIATRGFINPDRLGTHTLQVHAYAGLDCGAYLSTVASRSLASWSSSPSGWQRWASDKQGLAVKLDMGVSGR
jgi:hypothetical protein